MPELSTLLRQRLRATENRTASHPDPDVLTAYVEELLPAQEREHVLKHLSLCSDCREIVALTTPDMAVAAAEAQAEAATPVRNRRWFLSPAFGLAGSVAAVALGVTLILRLPTHINQTAGSRINQPVQQARVQAPAAPSVANGLVNQNNEAAMPSVVAEQHSPAPMPSVPRLKAESARPAADLRSAVPIRRASTVQGTTQESAVAPVFTAELGKQDYVNKMFLASTSENAAAASAYRELPQAPVPVQPNTFFAPPTVVVGNGYQNGAAFEVSSNAPGKNQGVVTFYSRGGQSSRAVTLLDKVVDLGKRPLGRRPGAPISSASLGSSAMFRPGMAAAESADAVEAKSNQSPEAGVLAHSKAFSSNALAALPRRQMLGAPQYQWKVVQGRLLRSSDNDHWTAENPDGENLQFSIVSSNGAEVWAGGEQAALLHSRDAGTTWERITLGSAATGTISTIAAAGRNVHVKSSSGQSWISQDGGRSWMLE